MPAGDDDVFLMSFWCYCLLAVSSVGPQNGSLSQKATKGILAHTNTASRRPRGTGHVVWEGFLQTDRWLAEFALFFFVRVIVFLF